MIYFVIATTIFTGLSTVLCLWSVSLARAARAQQRFPERRLSAAEVELADLRDRVERLFKFAQKINSRQASQAARDARSEPESATLDQGPGETPAQWKERARRELALKHFGRTNDGG